MSQANLTSPDTVSRPKDVSKIEPISEKLLTAVKAPACSNSFNLRDYQQKGVQWLLSLHTSRLNGILADEMGLGKTLQVIAFLLALQKRHFLSGPHLVVMPLSVISSWKTDIAKFGGGKIQLHVHHGERTTRENSFHTWYRELKANRHCKRKIALFITTYELAIKDEHLLARLGRRGATVGWEYLIVDEAHRLKNKSSLLFDVLNCVHDTGRRLLLTGTPLQNNLNELWSLLHFVLPNIFRSETEFNELFSQQLDIDSDAENEDSVGIHRRDTHKSKLFRLMDMRSVLDLHRRCTLTQSEYRSAVLARLHALLKPYILRRLKVDVALELPPKVEKIVYCPLSGLQREIYSLFRARVESNSTEGDYSFVDTTGAFRKSVAGLNNLLMQLRKLCNHPYLVLEDLQTIPDNLYYEHLLVSSGKLFVLDRLLTQLLAQGSKVLIFSQMTAMLDILHGYLQGRGLNCARLDGSTPHEAREIQLRDFNKPVASPRNLFVNDLTVGSSLSAAPAAETSAHETTKLTQEDPSVFLLSTRAGGVGINLQAADTVILFDSDWNPQQDLQAISRAHRIGQTRPVLVLRLVSVGPDEQTYSVEQRILRRATKKLHAERQVLANGLFDLSDQTEAAAVFVTPDHTHRGKPNSNANCPVTGIKVEQAQESLLALFETITDSESVSTDCSSPVPGDGPPANLTSLSAHSSTIEPGSVPPTIKHLTKPTTAVSRVIDMYQLDFSAAGIARICERTDENSDAAFHQRKSTHEEDENIDQELTKVMNYPDSDTWSAWLYPGDPSGGREIRAAVLKTFADPIDAIPVRVLHAESPKVKGGSTSRKRGFAEKSLWKKVTDGDSEASAGEEDIALYRPNRTSRPSCSSPQAHRRQKRRTQRRSGSADSASEEGEDEGERSSPYRGRSPRRRSIPQRDARYTSDVEEIDATEVETALKDDDICALCGQAWVTQQEIHTFLDLKTQELMQRSPSVLTVTTPEAARHSPCRALTPSKKEGACSATAATTPARSPRGVSRMCSSDSLLSLISSCAPKPKSPSTVETRTLQQASPLACSVGKPSAADMLTMMILCDGCDGSYHMICVGLDKVPEEDWYCRLCQ